MNIIEQLNAEQAAKIEAKRTLPDFSPGDTVRVNVRVIEGTRTRIQAYEGVCIGRNGAGLNENFTVRKISYGEGVERVFPIYSPLVEGVEVVRRGKVRRAKLYYLRDRRGKSARIIENTGSRAKKLNDAERQAMLAEKARNRPMSLNSAPKTAPRRARCQSGRRGRPAAGVPAGASGAGAIAPLARAVSIWARLASRMAPYSTPEGQTASQARQFRHWLICSWKTSLSSPIRPSSTAFIR